MSVKEVTEVQRQNCCLQKFLENPNATAAIDVVLKSVMLISTLDRF